MAVHAPNTGAPTRATPFTAHLPETRRLDRALCDDVDALETTANYIDVLCECVQDEVDGFRSALLKSDTTLVAAYAGEWRTIETLLSLMKNQNRVVMSTLREFANVDRVGVTL